MRGNEYILIMMDNLIGYSINNKALDSYFSYCNIRFHQIIPNFYPTNSIPKNQAQHHSAT